MCALCGCSSQDFMGVSMPNQNVYDVGATGVVPTTPMFGTDSMNTLGADAEKGKDID
jgi:hypothetical protein